MMNNRHFTAESFGSDLPENWEELCDMLNDFVDEHPDRDPDDIWEEFWGIYWGEPGLTYADVIAEMKSIRESMNMKVTNKAGTKIDFAASVNYMDDDIREDLNASMAPCSQQEFFTAYEEKHAERFGEEWELSKENPVW